MACCRLPDDVQKKIDEVRKKLGLKTLTKFIRVAGELSWNDWKEDIVVDKLYQEFVSVEKQDGNKTKEILRKIVKSLTRELKGLNYNFPPRERFCSLHMWFTKNIGNQPSTQPLGSSRLKQSDIRQRVKSIAKTVARINAFRQADQDAVDDDAALGSHSPLKSSPLSKRMELELIEEGEPSDQMVEDPAGETLMATTKSTTLTEPAIPVSWRVIPGEPIVDYDPHDAEVTANLLAYLSKSYIERTIVSRIFSYLVVHALQLRASRLTEYYYKKCAPASKRMKDIGPMPTSQKSTLEEDRATLSDILAKYELSHQMVMDVKKQLTNLAEKLPSFPEIVSLMSCHPVNIKWEVPRSAAVERLEYKAAWTYLQSCMEDCRTQVQQDPYSRETVEMLKKIPELIKNKPLIAEHPQVQDWLDGVRRLSATIQARNTRTVDVEAISKKIREFETRFLEALEEIKNKLVELSRRDHQVMLLQEHSRGRFNALQLRNQDLIMQRESLLKKVEELNIKIAQGEYDMEQEHTFHVKMCLPRSFTQVVTLLKPIFLPLTKFVQQGLGSKNLEDLLRERLDGDIEFLSRMVCCSQAVEASTTKAVGSEGYQMTSPSSSRSPAFYDALKNSDPSEARRSKKQRCV